MPDARRGSAPQPEQTPALTMSSNGLLNQVKLAMPRPGSALVPRARLIEGLGLAGKAALVLICAPAGFGKTTLVVQWLLQHPCRVAWFGIDRQDAEPRRFIAHLIAAIARVAPGFGQDHLRQVLEREAGADVSDVVRLVNDITHLPEPLVLVLDDYHEIDTPEVHALTSALTAQSPGNLSIVMTSRSNPPLPLARLRASGRLVEVSARDLRFDDDEAHAFVTRGLALELPAALTSALNRKTEGWAAGLQLAGLSVRHAPDAAALIAAFDSRDRFIADYLTEEVLGRQLEDVRHFLMATSILDRMNASLAAAVSGVSDGQAYIDRLEREHMFIVALDNRREWYRYHPLFADLLRHQLALREGDAAAVCHARASDWYFEHGTSDDAVTHALAARDHDRVGRVMDRDGWHLIAGMGSRAVASWAAAIDTKVLCANAERLVAALVSRVIVGLELDPALLDRAQRLVADASGSHPHYATVIAWVKGCLLARQHRYAEAAETFGGVRTDAAGLPAFLAALPYYCRATASYWQRDLDAAMRRLDEAMGVSLAGRVGAGYFPSVLNMFEIHRMRGELPAAHALLEHAVEEAAAQGWRETVGMGWMRFAQGELLYGANDLQAAEEAYDASYRLTRYGGSNTMPMLARMRSAMTAHLLGKTSEAAALAREVQSTPHRHNTTFIVGLYGRMLAHMWLVLGKPPEPAWMRDTLGLTPGSDEPDPAREEDLAVLARWHLVLGQAAAVLPMLVRAAGAAERGGRRRNACEFLLLQALARQQLGDTRHACALLEPALAMAVSGAEQRLYLDAAPGIAPLIARALKEGTLSPGAQTAARDLIQTAQHEAAHGLERPHGSAPAEALSRKELQVLRLLAKGHSAEEIAACAFVSINTVKTHLRRIYAKLEVGNRGAAIARAAVLRLLETRD